MNTIKYGMIAVVVFGVCLVPQAQAQTSNIPALLEQVAALMQQVESLQGQLAELRGEVRAELKLGLKQGMSDEDIKMIQEILATDKTIYPEGLVTGYFGPLTSAALSRFQQKFELETTGTINEETRAYLEELLQERFGEKIPPGLLTAPGIQKKVELRLEAGCDNSGPGTAPFCKKIRIKIDGDDDENDDEDDAEDEDDNDQSKADEALDDAAEMIDALEEALNDADEDADGYDEAADALEEAEEKFAEAQEAYDEEEYDEAEEKADEAEDVAEEGIEALEDEDSDDEDDDNDNEEDEDEEDED